NVQPRHIRRIVGPSGCRKSTIAKHLWPSHYYGPRQSLLWPEDQSILDALPARMPIKDLIHILSSVGFSSPPAWLRPYHVLSTGQQFRVTLARLIAAMPDLFVMDEYTSVVDRTVAQTGSAALARTIRQRKQQFVAVTCHEDVEPWLNPDWLYRPDVNQFTWRSLQQRPAISLQVQKV